MIHVMDSKRAFEKALESGRLTDDCTMPNWAGHYMYMGTDEEGHDLFKNIDSREYDV